MKLNVPKNPRSLSFKLIAIVVLAINSVQSDESLDRDATRPEVTISVGSLRGVHRTTILGRNVSAFLGIPYAQPPIGELSEMVPDVNVALVRINLLHSAKYRFEAPVASTAWNGTLEADSDGPKCPQHASLFDANSDIVGDEDCLYLNVYTPTLPEGTDAELLPTMVYIFGGVFKGGSADSSVYGPNYLLDGDVVLVVPSYRLGALGFLSTGDEAAPGNFGLKDMVLAFQWVQDNIKYFGGDPNRVTLFGHSSGAVCAHILALSPSMNAVLSRLEQAPVTSPNHFCGPDSRPEWVRTSWNSMRMKWYAKLPVLFVENETSESRRFITQSASALAEWSWSNRTTYKQHAFNLGESVGCASTNSNELIACLKTINFSALISYAPSKSDSSGTANSNIWLPTDELDMNGAIITDSPKNLFAAGKIPDVPWMTGVTRDEGVSVIACFDYYTGTIKDYMDLIIGFIMPYYNTTSAKDVCCNHTKVYYLNTLSQSVDSLVENISLVLGDYSYTYPVWKAVQEQVALTKNPTYFYTFNYVGTFSLTELACGTKVYGVSHADELTYLWNYVDSTYQFLNTSLSTTDLEMIRIMVRLWTSFAAYGVPLTSPETGTTIWKPYTLEDKNVLRIGEGSSVELEAQHSLHEERMHFWDEYYATLI